MKIYFLNIPIVLMVYMTLSIANCQLSTGQERVLPFLPENGSFPFPEGSLSISGVSIQEEGDSLALFMELFLVSQSINSCQSWCIRPEVKSMDGSILLPFILINGKKKEQQLQRRIRLGDTNILTGYYIKKVARRNKGHRIQYQVKVPYERWMDNAGLHFHQILSSCHNREQWFTLYDVAFVEPAAFSPYEPQVRVNYIQPQEEAKIRELEGVAFLDFRPGSSEIIPSYRRNTQELSKIEASIRSVQENPDITVLGLHIHGYSSPEGSYSLNERLSQGRSEALSNYLQGRFNLSPSILHVTSTAEDWEGLKMKVEESQLANRERILGIIENPSFSPDQKEQHLKTLGSTYQTLLNQFFPSLRRVSYRIEYTVRDYTPLEAEKLLEQNPGNLSPAELFHLAQNYGEESSKWGEILQLSALLYPDEPVTRVNLAAWLLQKGETESAGKLLERIKEEEIALNNTGVYYLLTHQPDKATEYLLKAKAVGILSAEYNLNEVDKIKEDIERQHHRFGRNQKE